MADTRASVWSYRHVVLLLVVAVHQCHCAKGTLIKSLYACTDIKYRFATTRITSHVTNPTNQSRQAVFDITLPNDAFISNFTLTVNSQTYQGRVEERREAIRRFLDNSTLEQSSAGTITQRPRETNQFRVTLKVAPFQGVTFNLTYQEILERRSGYYDHVLYIDPGQPVEDLRVDVSIEENREISHLHVPPMRSDLLTDYDIAKRNSLVRVERPSDRQAYISYHPSARHQQLQGMSRDGLSGLFTVRYNVKRSMDAGEVLSVNGYFVHFIAPQVEDPIPKDVLFVLDTSTSMMWQKLGQLQDAMRIILKDLKNGDRFALMQFNSRATFWRRELLPVTPITIQWAMEYVDSLKARGYTNIDSALAQGLDFFNDDNTVNGNNSLIIFLTDGRPTRGETDRDAILRHVRAKNRKKVAVYGLAFGKDADWPLVKRATAQNHGIGRRIYQDADAALQIQGFYNEVSTLLLTGVQAAYLDSEVDIETLTKTLFLKYFNGSELVVAGKLIRLNQTALQVFVEATGRKGQVNLTVVPDPDPLTPGQVKSCGLLEAKDLTELVEKMWAYLTIRQMLQERVGEDDPLIKQELQEKATRLALRYNFVTPVTSMVVSKPGAEELAFLQEDASDLLDESDPWIAGENDTVSLTSTRSPRTSTPTRTTPQSSPETSPSPDSIALHNSTVSPDLHKAIALNETSSPSETITDKPHQPVLATDATQPKEKATSESPSLPEDSALPTGAAVSEGLALPNGAAAYLKNTTDSLILPERVVLPNGTVMPESTTALPRGHSFTDKKSSRGGGGGDPHFMVEMTSLPYPLCYDITGNTGDVFRLLRDPSTGLTVNVEIEKGHWKPPNSSRFPRYITKAAILLQDVIAEVTTAHVKVNDILLEWGTTRSVYFPGVWVMVENSALRFALDWSVEIDVTKHVRNGTNERGVSFLNVEIQREAKLSRDSTGLLGQFVHKDVRLQKIKKRHGRLVAELEILDNKGGHLHISHGRALLKNRRDPYFRRLSSCLMVDALWSHTMDRPTRFYKVDSIYRI